MNDREALWNAVEAAEKRKDAQLSREVQLALPCELSRAQRLSLVRDFVLQEFVACGMIADLAIHEPHRQGDDRNHHAHVMLTLRALTAEGFGNKNRVWNARGAIEQWREAWAAAVNRALEYAGHEQKIDHRTLEAQRAEVIEKAGQARTANDNRTAQIMEFEAVRLDRDPEPKIGHIPMALERRGEQTERGNLWREVIGRNRDRFSAWIEMQRAKLSRLSERFESAAILESKRDQAQQKMQEQDDAKAPRFTLELRERLLGRESKKKKLRFTERER